MPGCSSEQARVLLSAALVAAVATVSPLATQDGHEKRVVRPHASKQFKSFTHSSGAYAFELPDDWQAHERGERTNVGAENGLVPTERGFRTVYGVIVQIADDPLAGKAGRSAEASTQAIVEQVLKRNPHQAIKEPVRADKPLAGAPAFRAVLNGTSPVTGKGERAEIVVRQHGPAQVFYLVLVSPIDDHASLEATLGRVRNSVRIPGR